MKRSLSILLALVIAITSLGAGTAVFAKESKTDLYNYVEAEKKGAAAFLLDGVDSFDVNSAVEYLAYLKSGYDMSAYNNAFLASVKSNLETNNGKLQTPAVAGYKSEIGIYGAVIQILEILGKDAANFEGYNIVSAFESLDINDSYHPYYYRVAIEAANEEYAKQICDKYIANFYVLGSGLNYWGFSCDNTAHFLTAISKYKSSYSNYVEDAKAVIKSYTKANGAFCDVQWAPDVNADSTALAMMAFASIGDVNTAFNYFKNLVVGFESSKTGVFLYDGTENKLATKDALLSLEYFNQEVNKQNFEHPEPIYTAHTIKATVKEDGSITTTCIICGGKDVTIIPHPETVSLKKNKYTYNSKAITPEVSVTDSKGEIISAENYTVEYKDNKAVGSAKAVITFKGDYYSGSITKTFMINPKGTKIASVSAKKKGFTAKWKKQASKTSGYQIQYSTKKDFGSSVIKTVKGTKTTSKTVTKLKANKKYFVRVRTYTNKNGKKFYSDWSQSKSVKTK